MRTIAQKLNITAQQYEQMIFTKYAKWCESISANELQYQTALANAAISKWFMTEFKKCEAEFHVLTNPFEGSNKLSASDLQTCYNQCTYRMFNIRPTPLLAEIKKIKPYRYPILTLNLSQN